jgi:hypothetical protein
MKKTPRRAGAPSHPGSVHLSLLVPRSIRERLDGLCAHHSQAHIMDEIVTLILRAGLPLTEKALGLD